MKSKTILTSVAAALVVVSFTACNQSQSNTESPGGTPGTNTTTIVDTAKETAAKVAETTKEVAAEAVATATNAINSATAQFDAAVAKVKQAITDKNYQGALDLLNKATSLASTPEQQKTLSDLKAEVQKLLTTGTGVIDAAKGLFGK